MTDDRNTLRERLEAATGERIAVLEAIELEQATSPVAGRGAGLSANRGNGLPVSQERERRSTPEIENVPQPRSIDHDLER